MHDLHKQAIVASDIEQRTMPGIAEARFEDMR